MRSALDTWLSLNDRNRNSNPKRNKNNRIMSVQRDHEACQEVADPERDIASFCRLPKSSILLLAGLLF